MFDCSECKNKQSEIESLRFRIKHLEQMNDKLTDRLLASAQPVSLPEDYKKEDYYGGGNDEVIDYHPVYGNRFLKKQ